jgi:hypothetical protein
MRMPAKSIRDDRILDEAHATDGDVGSTELTLFSIDFTIQSWL